MKAALVTLSILLSSVASGLGCGGGGGGDAASPNHDSPDGSPPFDGAAGSPDAASGDATPRSTCTAGVDTITPDNALADRAAKALTHVSLSFKAFRSYDKGDRSDCNTLWDDSWSLLARLELDKRSLSGGASPVEAEPWAKHLADVSLPLIGTNGVQARCSFGQAGSGGVYQTAATLAYMLVRYGGGWGPEIRESIRALVEDGAWGPQTVSYLSNGQNVIAAAEILAGEALDRPTLITRGLTRLDSMFERTLAHGGVEENAPLYTAEHFPYLVFLQSSKDEHTRAKARVLLEYELLMEAHLVLPEGGFTPPKSRDYTGGIADGGSQSLRPVLWLLTGNPYDTTVDINKAYGAVVMAASEYVLPETIRSIYLDKGDGYTFWAYTDAQQGSQKSPNALYELGLAGAKGSPWQAIVLPGGVAATGLSYGWRDAPLGVNPGTTVKLPAGGYAILYQYQPWVAGDTDDLAKVIGGSGGGSSVNDNPDDFLSELYDYERMAFGRTVISLWDPTLQGKQSGVVRTWQDTRVHLPNYGALGGEQKKAGAFRVGRIGDVYIAYLPLGTVAAEESRDEGAWTYLRLAGASGGVVELATTKDFPTLDAYAADLEARTVTFVASPLSVEIDARDPATGKKHRIRLEYRPERRFVDGVEQTVANALGHGLMQSPWVSWNAETEVMRVSRPCYPTITYDWKTPAVTTEPY